MKPTKQFHLILANESRALPDGPAWLTPSTSGSGFPRISRRRSNGNGCALGLEPVRLGNLEGLLFTSPPEGNLRINGIPAPRVGLLLVKDLLQLDGGPPLHVSLYLRPDLGPPRAELIGRPCARCRVNVVAKTQVYVCPACQTVMHAEGDEMDDDERLECFALGDCPGCGEPVRVDEGLIWTPED